VPTTSRLFSAAKNESDVRLLERRPISHHGAQAEDSEHLKCLCSVCLSAAHVQFSILGKTIHASLEREMRLAAKRARQATFPHNEATFFPCLLKLTALC
jgi:hypothetical protein